MQNPADIGSRGATASCLAGSKLWWEGPDWLGKGESEWQKDQEMDDSVEVKNERKKACVLTVTANVSDMKVGNIIDVGRYSIFDRLLRVTAWVNRFVYNMKRWRDKNELRLGSLEVTELEEAERHWIMDAQEDLKKGKDFEKTNVNLGLVLREKIYIFQDKLGNSEIDLQSRNPMILSKEHRFTHSVVLDCHKKVHHLKVGAIFAELRSKF